MTTDTPWRFILLVVIAGILALAVVLTGPVFTVLGVKELLDSQHFLATAQEADGIVVGDFKRSVATPDGAPMRAYPVVEFVTTDGEVVRFRAARGSNPPDFRVGSPLRVLYDPANPRNVQFDTWIERWGDGVLSTAFGVGQLALLTFLGYPYLARRIRRRRALPPDRRPRAAT